MQGHGDHLSTAMLMVFIGGLVFFAHASQMAFRKFKVPDTLWLICLGIAVGPLLGWLTPEDFGVAGPLLTSVALAVILFEAGLELHLKELRESIGSAALLTLVVFAMTAALVAVLVHFWTGFSWITSIFAGVVAAAPSPPVVIPLLKGLALSPKLRTTVTIESAIGEALGLVVALGILRIAAVKGDADVGVMIGSVVSSFVVAAVLGLGFGVGWALVLGKIRGLRNAMILTPALIFILFGVTEVLGFSGPIAVLVSGIVLANATLFAGPDGDFRMGDLNVPLTNVNATESRFLGELVFILKTFFFVFLGLNMRVQDLWSPLALIVVAILVITRMASVRICLGNFVQDARTGTLLGTMVPKGLAAAVLAAAAQRAPGLHHGDQVDNLLYAVILYSIVITAILIFAVERLNLARYFSGWLFPERQEPVNAPTSS